MHHMERWPYNDFSFTCKLPVHAGVNEAFTTEIICLALENPQQAHPFFKSERKRLSSHVHCCKLGVTAESHVSATGRNWWKWRNRTSFPREREKRRGESEERACLLLGYTQAYPDCVGTAQHKGRVFPLHQQKRYL